MRRDAPIGVFDSGLGGLSVVREIRRLLPAEDVLYLADTRNCPYGGRPLAEIETLSLRAGAELVERGAKLVVVACNTASGAALERLRAELPVPIVGVEPAVKPAALRTRTRRIGVMATRATLRTERFGRLTDAHARDVEVVAVACPGLVELVERGRTSGEEVRSALLPYVAPLREAGVDVVVLGCTHYPFLRGAIAALLGPAVEVIDSGAAIARQCERVLRDGEGLAERKGSGSIRVLTTGDPVAIAAAVERLLGSPLPVADAYRPEAASQVANSGGPPPGRRST